MSTVELSTSGTPAAVVTGIGACLPERVIKNDEIAERLDVTTDWIRERTGIEQRHVLEPGASTSDLATEAARRALESAGLDRVGFLVIATCTPDHSIPGTAPVVAARLGLGGIPAFDVNAACSGFLYALTIGAGLLAAGTYTTGLVIGAEAMSTVPDPDDRMTAPLFGDGAGAVVIRAGRPDEPGALAARLLGSDGEQADLLVVPAGGARQRVAGTVPERAEQYLQMQGRVVYRNAVARMTEASQAVMNEMGWSVEEVDWLVGHQANKRILDATAAAIGIPPERAIVNVDRVANTSAASIPLALADAAESGLLHPGDRIVLTAFGAGLTWAAAAITWPELG
ncbi:beta-ketoacyl-ACP synthase III [Dactylosporangium sp. CA-092794]|uniref:beta-ketoacyl-ACP synthase III n=1 Tax=Dactylosporangium sp. CA-092794 TaxID=3239929 RepID=UPI003D8D0BC3